ncbi:MAG: SAM-dependent methyltransferase [Armatimonadota bacterium]
MADQPASGGTGGPSPIGIFEALNGYQRTAALKAAIELDLFTAVGEGSDTSAKLALRCEASERGIRILADHLTILGFLTKEGDRYGLTRDSAVFLNRRSAAYVGGAIEFMLSPEIMEAHQSLAQAVRQGSTTLSGEGSMEDNHPVWVAFARGMAPMMAPAAAQLPEIAPLPADRPTRVLDIAAGHGLFGIAYAKRFPPAEVTALDWAAVLEVARENAEQAGVADRYRLQPGSVFTAELGQRYDLILLTNFLHHMDLPACEELLRRLRPALAEGGRVVTLEFVPNPDRVTPPPAAAFALTMLATTRSGDAYTFEEYDRTFRSAGYGESRIYPLQASAEQVIVTER